MMIFWPDGNDSVAESSDGDMPDEQIPHMHVILLKPGKCLFPKVIPHFNMATFCYHDNSTFIHTHKKKPLPLSVNYQHAKSHHSPFTKKHTMLL